MSQSERMSFSHDVVKDLKRNVSQKIEKFEILEEYMYIYSLIHMLLVTMEHPSPFILLSVFL
jgi:hypothetical protein